MKKFIVILPRRPRSDVIAQWIRWGSFLYFTVTPAVGAYLTVSGISAAAGAILTFWVASIFGKALFL